MFDNFLNITGYSIEDFLNSYLFFIDNYYQNIYAFYSGDIKNADIESFSAFKIISDDCDIIKSCFQQYTDQLQNGQYWELLEQIENIDETIQTIWNLSKWLRTNISQNFYKNGIEIDYILKQGETIEFISSKINPNSPDQEVINLSIENVLVEEAEHDGSIVKIIFPNQEIYGIQSVVANLTKDQIYGLDLDQNLNIVGEDLSGLSAKNTVTQIINILLNLKQNNNPDFPNEGLKTDIIVGSNINSAAYPIIFRQLSQLFFEEDSIKSFSLKDIQQEQDNLSLAFNIETKLGENIMQPLSL